jgi:hypothetical protein
MEEPFDRQFLGGATGHYARGHLDNISGRLHGRRPTHPNSRATPQRDYSYSMGSAEQLHQPAE